MIRHRTHKLAFLVLVGLWLPNASEVFAAPGDLVTVSLENGVEIRGWERSTLYTKRPFASFKGLPFAEAPVGQLRFKVPVAKQLPPTLDAFEHGDVCLQPHVQGSEDCLFLNIYSPDVSAQKKLPVMFYIHGGAFVEGSGNDNVLGADFLIEQNVVLVTTNYRLGVFGFLSLATPHHSGNMGLKDQQLALRFVRQHIDRFGGDPEQVTIFGQSAGGVSTHLHVLADSSAGLFRRAIPMSGSVGNALAVQPKSDHVLQMFDLAQKFDPTISTLRELQQWLLRADANVFLDHIDVRLHLETFESTANLIYAPVVENPNAVQPILLKEYLLRRTGNDVDVMFGQTNSEHIFFLDKKSSDPSLLERLHDNFDIVLPFLDFSSRRESKHYAAMLAEVRQFYFGDARIDGETLTQFIDMMSDIIFGVGIHDSVKKQDGVSQGKTFYYLFSATTNFNVFKTLLNASYLEGAAHCDELCYIFRCQMLPNVYDVATDSVERTVQSNVLKVWTNFAKHGHPMGEQAELTDIRAVNASATNYFDIGNDGLTVGQNPYQRRFDFWSALYDKYTKVFGQITERDEL